MTPSVSVTPTTSTAPSASTTPSASDSGGTEGGLVIVPIGPDPELPPSGGTAPGLAPTALTLLALGVAMVLGARVTWAGSLARRH